MERRNFFKLVFGGVATGIATGTAQKTALNIGMGNHFLNGDPTCGFTFFGDKHFYANSPLIAYEPKFSEALIRKSF